VLILATTRSRQHTVHHPTNYRRYWRQAVFWNHQQCHHGRLSADEV